MIHEERLHVPGFAARTVRTYVPTGLGKAPAPLLILFDGQNVFDDRHSFAGGWYAHTAVSKLAKTRYRPIVVGVDHGGPSRLAELSPWGIRGEHGRAEAFTGWMAHDLLPMLRQRHHLIEGPVGVLVGGSSMGGLAAFYAHLRWPEAFGGALCMSPSFWVGGHAVVDMVRATQRPWVSKIYLDGGEHEARGSVARRNHDVAHALRERGWDDDHLKDLVDKRGAHSERSWKRRLPAALRWFYPQRPRRTRSKR